MKRTVFLAALLWGLLTGLGAAAAQQGTILGTWNAVDPATGREEQLIVTADRLQFGPDEPALPYTATQNGNIFTLQIGEAGAMPPLLISLLSDNEATLTLPGATPIAMTRVATAPEPEAPAATGETADDPAAPAMVDEMLSAMVPFGVTTRFEPLKQSLEQLLSDGWSLDQAGGAGGGFTLLLSKGETRALCMLIPKQMGQADTALSDCRRLN